MLTDNIFKKKTVLVLDGESRAALAVVRSLGHAGLRVIVGSKYRNSLAGSSRYCFYSVQYFSPIENMDSFTQSIRDIILKEKIDVLFPVTDESTFAVLKNRTHLDDIVSIPFVPYETYWAASNKIFLTKTAIELGNPCPSTIFIDSPSINSAKQYLSKLSYPVIIKPRASILTEGNRLLKTSVKFAKTSEELLHIIATDRSFTAPYMLQEVIHGDGIGIFAFCVEGKVLSVFSHHRVREKPPFGGISVVCESTIPDSSALDSSKKLLKALNWSGIAMVEFKRDQSRNNIPVLMEINARFWGSLQLSIDAGVNFPLYQFYLSQNICSNHILNPQMIDLKKNTPQINTNSFKHSRSRWLLGDLDHLIIRLKIPAKDPRYPQSFAAKIYAILLFFIEFLKGSKIEELRYGDVGPFWHALKLWVKGQ